MLSDELATGRRVLPALSSLLPLLSACHLTHLTNSVHWATHLYLSSEHELFRIDPPPLPHITTRRSSATCQLPKTACYLATIMEASSKECLLLSPRMAMISTFHTSILAPSQTHARDFWWNIINIMTSVMNQWWGRRGGGGVIMYHRL